MVSSGLKRPRDATPVKVGSAVAKEKGVHKKKNGKARIELDIDAIVKKHSDVLYIKTTVDNKLKIANSVTGHEIKHDLDTLLMYLNSKDFKKSQEKWYSHDDKVFEKYLPYIVPHKDPKKIGKKMYCTLTKQELNRIPFQIENHFNGKRFKKKLEERLNQEKAAKEEAEKLKKKKEERINRRANEKDTKFELGELEKELGYTDEGNNDTDEAESNVDAEADEMSEDSDDDE